MRKDTSLTPPLPHGFPPRFADRRPFRNRSFGKQAETPSRDDGALFAVMNLAPPGHGGEGREGRLTVSREFGYLEKRKRERELLLFRGNANLFRI